MILAGDIGGTKTLVALYERDASHQMVPLREAIFPSRSHSSLEAILSQFLKGETVDAGCFGVAGAVVDGKCQTTNLPWQLDEQELARAIRAPRVKLLNDLEAAAYGVLFLTRDELYCLQPGRRTSQGGNIAVLAAGTGLGEAFLYWDGSNYHPLASEGGHADFAPRTDQEIALLQYLRHHFGTHVSYERILSGAGFHHLYSFLRDTGIAPESADIADLLKEGDPSPTIAKHGLAGTDGLCAAAVDLFCQVYGAAAGNLALHCVALGGVYLGGGIAPKILPALKKPGFLQAFRDKGRLRDLVEGMPVFVALNDRAGLLGAAHYGARL